MPTLQCACIRHEPLQAAVPKQIWRADCPPRERELQRAGVGIQMKFDSVVMQPTKKGAPLSHKAQQQISIATTLAYQRFRCESSQYRLLKNSDRVPVRVVLTFRSAWKSFFLFLSRLLADNTTAGDQSLSATGSVVPKTLDSSTEPAYRLLKNSAQVPVRVVLTFRSA